MADLLTPTPNPQPPLMSFTTPDHQPVSDGPTSGADQLRAFEDATFGADAVRINGQIERGHGSRFNTMTPQQQRHYAALERLITAENNLAAAQGNLSIAESDHEAARVAAENAARAVQVLPGATVAPLASPDGNWNGPTVKEFVAAGYSAKNYPPAGYASRSTPEEVAAAIAEEQKALDAKAAKAKDDQDKANAKVKADATAKASAPAPTPAPTPTPAPQPVS